jgi:hypothetical protein
MKELKKLGCCIEDIAKARLASKRNVDRLDWLQDAVNRERNQRLSNVSSINEDGLPQFPNGEIDWENMTPDQYQKALYMGYFN